MPRDKIKKYLRPPIICLVWGFFATQIAGGIMGEGVILYSRYQPRCTEAFWENAPYAFSFTIIFYSMIAAGLAYELLKYPKYRPIHTGYHPLNDEQQKTYREKRKRHQLSASAKLIASFIVIYVLWHYYQADSC